MITKEYNFYKGCQKPLVFKSFKGKFIYYGLGSVLGGLLLTMIISSITTIWVGLVIGSVIVGGGLTYSAVMQKDGLQSKNKAIGVFIIPTQYYRNHDKD